MRDTIRGIPVGNRARERIGYLMRDAISIEHGNPVSQTSAPGERRFLPTTHRKYAYGVKKGTNATRVKFLSSPTE